MMDIDSPQLVAIHHLLGYNWHPLEGAGKIYKSRSQVGLHETKSDAS